MKKITAHKNESPVSAGQIVKTILKSATGIIATVDRFLTFDIVMLMLAFDVGFIGILLLTRGIL